jgi:site-specific recombinase XerD
MIKTIETETAEIEGKKRICLYFPYNQEIITLIKSIPGARWNPGRKCWHVATAVGPADKLNNRFQGKLEFVPMEELRPPLLKPGVESATIAGSVPVEFIKTLRVRQYSQKTIGTYTTMLKLFLQYYSPRKPESLTQEDVRDYLLYLVDKKKVSQSYQNQAINAIKFYYEKILGRPKDTYYLARPRHERVLPNVLSEEEVVRLLKTIDNLKHRMALSLIYSAGLRIGELINLRLEDVDSTRSQLRIRQGKGKKDRVSILSPKILEMLRKYYKVYRPKEWLFEGQYGGQYTARSIQNVFQEAKSKAGIRKKATVHTLRHSFATHLLERGTSLRYIQELLGHQSSRTTEIYTHITDKGIAKIISPFDTLDI